jgi:tRNA U34 2-thiouridine synthase MnmA/TrmU
MSKKIKAIGLLSGGLDSTLAVKILVDMGLDVTALNFISPFCACTHKGCQHEATRIAKEFGIEIKVLLKGNDYLEVVRNPKHGYGKNVNPCIDCRIFMLKKTKLYMEEIGASFIFSGEVLGQRPMSQRKSPMLLIEREAGLEGLILRPLSARLLKPTIPELKGWVDREKLLEISGKSRKPQFELADRLGIKDFNCPAGGCRLTDAKFALRLKESFNHGEDIMRDVRLLKYGRHFRLPGGAKVIVGRNEKENAVISSLAEETELMLETMDCGSPVTLLKGSDRKTNGKELELAASLCVTYSKCDFENPRVKIFDKKSFEKYVSSKPVLWEETDISKVD